MKKVKQQQNLLDVRKEALEQMAHGSIRPHGKLWGLDVFSWSNPPMEALASTIHAFPFPVILLSSANCYQEVYNVDPEILSNIHEVLSLDSSVTDSVHLDNVVRVADVVSAMHHVRNYGLKRGVLMVCFSGADSEFFNNAFKTFLTIHQM